MLAIFLDIESTGLDPSRHRVIEIAIKCLDINTQKIKGSYHAVVKQPYEVWEKRDSFSIEVNGFQWSEVEAGMGEADVGHNIVGLFKEWSVERGKSVFICQNPAFDRSFFAQIVDLYTQERLKWPYHWLDLASMYWAFNMEQCLLANQPFPSEMSLSKDQIAQFYGLPKENQPHRAMNGVDHLILCYQAIFQKLPAQTLSKS